MKITIWILKSELAKFMIMRNYAIEATTDFDNGCTVTGNGKVQSAKANEVVYYEQLNEQVANCHKMSGFASDNIKVSNLSTLQISLDVYEYLSLEAVRIATRTR